MSPSRRGVIFFWIVQALLVPALACFVATCAIRFGYRSPRLWQLGTLMSLAQIPCTGLAVVFTFAAGAGELLPRRRILMMYLEVTGAIVMIALVFLWRGVYLVF